MLYFHGSHTRVPTCCLVSAICSASHQLPRNHMYSMSCSANTDSSWSQAGHQLFSIAQLGNWLRQASALLICRDMVKDSHLKLYLCTLFKFPSHKRTSPVWYSSPNGGHIVLARSAWAVLWRAAAEARDSSEAASNVLTSRWGSMRYSVHSGDFYGFVASTESEISYRIDVY